MNVWRKQSVKWTKKGKAVTLPLSKTLATKLLLWFETLNREALWPGSWADKRMGGKMLKRDLKRCGIAYVDEQGRLRGLSSFTVYVHHVVGEGGRSPE